MTHLETKLPVSVIVLAHEPTRLLEQALRSAAWASERILMVTAESSEWVKLAHEFQAVLVQYPGEVTDFAKVRNWAITHASQEWVFFLDSDEEIQQSSVAEIAQVIETQIDGVLIKRVDIFHGKQLKWGETRNTNLLRLARKAHYKFIRPVHEVGHVSGEISASQILIYHYAHQSVSEFLSSVTVYARLEAQYRAQLGKQFSIVRLLIFPSAKALYNVIFKLGFLDGFAGLTYIVMMSLHSLLVSVFLYEQNKNK
jgi:glycosyltransferase involved in cell wall biosynthesis